MDQMTVVKDTLGKTGKYWIAFVGDSITSAEWVHPNWREIVEYVLKEELQPKFKDWRVPSWGIRCFNYGFDGASSRDIAKLASDGTLKTRLDLVIVMIGANDKIKRVSLMEHKGNIGKIIEALKPVETVWATDIRPNNLRAAKTYKDFVEEDRKYKWGMTKFIDTYAEFDKLELNKLYTFKYKDKPDFWHPNQLGNAYIAKIILREAFGIEFDPEKYIRDTLSGEKYPGY
ncbi:MAG: SGNH/GDSL hydrolase family protein [Candidatus Shapirobacteria bacterium]